MTERDFLDNLWKWKCGLSEITKIEKKPSLEELKESEWCSEFENLQRNRLIMGALRYQLLNKDRLSNYNHLQSLKNKTNQFEETGNAELLVDMANYCMLIYYYRQHKKFHFKSEDDKDHCNQF